MDTCKHVAPVDDKEFENAKATLKTLADQHWGNLVLSATKHVLGGADEQASATTALIPNVTVRATPEQPEGVMQFTVEIKRGIQDIPAEIHKVRNCREQYTDDTKLKDSSLFQVRTMLIEHPCPNTYHLGGLYLANPDPDPDNTSIGNTFCHGIFVGWAEDGDDIKAYWLLRYPRRGYLDHTCMLAITTNDDMVVKANNIIGCTSDDAGLAWLEDCDIDTIIKLPEENMSRLKLWMDRV